ncbi:unnamed protein product [Caenorhabditis bovis]|uniref:Serpentine receptor class gamma n=1 Tax=Caenorhabditis bovis TaxID=2654633 RepID=A0A8S1EKJ8_9PELO|nr:unnamed protein product [Caenorhabditis bovis]
MQYYAETAFFFEFTLFMRFRKHTALYSLFEPQEKTALLAARIVSGIHYYIKIVVYIGYIAFAVNRITSAINISSYNSSKLSLFTPKRLMIIRIGQWIIPLFFVLPTHSFPGFEFWFTITTSAIRLHNDDLSTAIIAYVDGFWCISTCLFCMVCYFLTTLIIRKSWKNVGKDSKKAARVAAERGLLISALVSFFVLTLNTIVQIVTILNSWGAMKNLLFIQDLSYPMIDLLYSHYPWALLVTSSVLRKQMIYDIKIFLRKTLKLDDASVVRVGHTVSPATMRTSTRAFF